MSFLRRKQEPEQASTFIDAAIGSALDEQGGRYGKGVPTITGAMSQYPRQGDDSPWSQGAAVPPEAPLGIDVNFVPPVGEKFEVDAQRSPPSLPTPSAVEDTVQDAPVAFPAVERPASNQEIDDDWVGERRSDGVPVGNPLGLKRRA
jgi:hypothetical protein